MNKEVQFKRFFKLTSIVTDLSQKQGARFIDILFKNLMGNYVLLNSLKLQQRRRVRGLKRLNKILVVGDLNIGDAIIATNGVTALRKIFPDVEIDLVVKKITKDLLTGFPDISNLFAIYNGTPFLSDNDFNKLNKIINHKNYDLIINYSPMITNGIFDGSKIINYHTMAAELIRNEKFDNVINNVGFQSYNFIGNIFKDYLPPDFHTNYKGSKIYLSDEAIEKAGKFLTINGISRDKPLIMFNPDASAKYTRIPLNYQAELLKRLSEFDGTILLGAGHVQKYIEEILIGALPANSKKKIVIIPSIVKLDTYAALVDSADVFLTGDTGNLHLAAARKFSRSTGKSLRNKTAVFGIFGGTPPHIYGYDSKIEGYIGANQDAPSRTFIAPSACRNITCINKLAKTCKEVRCFHSLNLDEIISETYNHINTIKIPIVENGVSVT